MPRRANFAFLPGIVKDDTDLTTGKRWTDSNRIRFKGGLPQKLGGWQKHSANQFAGYCRGLKAWLDAGSAARIGVGTHKKLYALEGSDFTDITPVDTSGTLGTDPFTTTSGSATVSVGHTNHTRTVGDYVSFSGASAGGGITIDGEYTVVAVTDADNYTITHSTTASSSASGGGSSVAYTYDLHIGRPDGTEGRGWGVGTWGTGTWGTPRTDFILLPPRTWTLSDWGQYLVACPRGGSIYQWTLNPATPATILANAPTQNTGIFVTKEKHLVAYGAENTAMLVEWCSQDDNTIWTPSDLNTAGSRTLVGGSELLFGVPTAGTNFLLSDTSAFTMTFIGGQDVFGFDDVGHGADGVIGPMAANELNGTVYWMGQTDFYMYNGAVDMIPKSEDIAAFVFDNIAQNQRDKVVCCSNALFDEIWFFYPTSTEIDRYVKYNTKDKCWDVGALSRTAMIEAGLFTYPIMAGADGYIYDHESGVDDAGAAMGEWITSSPFELGLGDRLFDIMSVIPDFKSLTGNVMVQILGRLYPQGVLRTTTMGRVTSTTQRLDRAVQSAKQAQLKIIGDSIGNDWRVGLTRFEYEQGGDR